MDDETLCRYCKHCHIQEEYWHDHYLIPKAYYCMLHTPYHDKEVKPDACCEFFSGYKTKAKKGKK